MADDLEGFVGTNSGMGQGLAYVLPQSRTTGYFMQLANEKAQERRQQALYLQKQQQQSNDEYAQHLYSFKTPEIANEYTKWLQPQYDALLTKASDYHSKTGQDPFVNPDFVTQTNNLNTIAKNTHQANVKATALATALADKSKNYTPESKQAASQWLQGYYKDPVGALYQQAPPLEQRDLGLNDAVKLGHANAVTEPQGQFNVTRPNTHNHIVQGQEILNQPEFAPLLQKQYGINTEVGDAFGQPNGTGGTLYPTDVASVNSIADHILQNATQPHFSETLQVSGIDPADPHAKDKLVDVIVKQNRGYGKAITDFSSRLDANVEQKKVRDYNPDRLDLATQRLQLAQERADKGTKPVDPTYFQDLSERMRTGVEGSGEEFAQQVAQNPLYKNGEHFSGVKFDTRNPKQVIVTVPPKYKDIVDPDSKERALIRVVDKPSYKVTLDSTDPNQWNSGFARLYKDVTGDATATPSKAMTQGGKGKVAGGLSNINQPRVEPAKDIATYEVEGRVFNIPNGKVSSFLKQFPKAKKR